MIAETSREAYATHRGLSRQQRLVHEYVKKVEQAGDGSLNSLPSNSDIAEAIGLDKGTVSARRNKLVDLGFLKVAGSKRDHRTGKRVDVLCTIDPNDKKLKEYGAAVTWD